MLSLSFTHICTCTYKHQHIHFLCREGWTLLPCDSRGRKEAADFAAHTHGHILFLSLSSRTSGRAHVFQSGLTNRGMRHEGGLCTIKFV